MQRHGRRLVRLRRLVAGHGGGFAGLATDHCDVTLQQFARYAGRHAHSIRSALLEGNAPRYVGGSVPCNIEPEQYRREYPGHRRLTLSLVSPVLFAGRVVCIGSELELALRKPASISFPAVEVGLCRSVLWGQAGQRRRGGADWKPVSPTPRGRCTTCCSLRTRDVKHGGFEYWRGHAGQQAVAGGRVRAVRYKGLERQ